MQAEPIIKSIRKPFDVDSMMPQTPRSYGLVGPNNPILKEIAAYVEYPAAHKDLVEGMISMLKAHNAAGLAAPQIGKSLRIIVCVLPGRQTIEGICAFFNPKILVKKGLAVASEKCLSVPSRAFMVIRAKQIKLYAQLIDGSEVTWKFNGMDARIIQHEVDHLNGILITDVHKY